MTERTHEARFCSKCGHDHSTSPVESHHLFPGTLLRERYRVGRVLGEGGFGITYVGWDTVLNLKVAIKEFYMTGYVSRMNTYSPSVQVSMSTHGEVFQKNRNRFLDEARVLARFAEEEGIVGIRDFFEENNTAYIVMSFLSGVTLKEHLKQHGCMTWEETYSIMRPILASLSTIHEQGIIHRDISPDNIMLTDRGQVKLLDFGAAREYSAGDVRSLSIILKPGYAPEEQYRTKGKQGPWTDVYALCATMYRCLTGVTPDESMERTFQDNVRPPHELCSCPATISLVLMKGLSVYAQDRYPSVAALFDALQQPDRAAVRPVPLNNPPRTQTPPVHTPDVPSDSPKTPPTKKKHTLAWAILGAAVILLTVLLVILIAGSPGTDSDKTGTPSEELFSGTKDEPQDGDSEESDDGSSPGGSSPSGEKPAQPADADAIGGVLQTDANYYADIAVAGYGTVTVLLDQNAAPLSAANFVQLAESGFYNGLTFHRIMEGFMVQGGDPNGNGSGGAEQTIPGEFSANGYENNLSHTRGTISMARSADYDSASSQFFIVQEDSPHLDGQYAAFGSVTEGMDIIDAICADAEPTDNNGTISAAEQPVITAITIRTGSAGPTAPPQSPEAIPPAVEKEPMALSQTEAELYHVGETLQLSVLHAENATIVWSSDNSSVAEVDSSGLVTARTTGTCLISADVDETRFTCTVHSYADPLEGLNAEDEVTRIRSINTEFVNRMNAGEFTPVTIRRGAVAYVDGDQILSIQVSAGTDGIPYARSYYYDEEGRLYFAFYSGSDSHRYYFYEGLLFRWRYTPDSDDRNTVINHDMEDTDEFRSAEDQVLLDSAALIDETQAVMASG